MAFLFMMTFNASHTVHAREHGPMHCRATMQMRMKTRLLGESLIMTIALGLSDTEDGVYYGVGVMLSMATIY